MPNVIAPQGSGKPAPAKPGEFGYVPGTGTGFLKPTDPGTTPVQHYVTVNGTPAVVTTRMVGGKPVTSTTGASGEPVNPQAANNAAAAQALAARSKAMNVAAKSQLAAAKAAAQAAAAHKKVSTFFKPSAGTPPVGQTPTPTVTTTPPSTGGAGSYDKLFQQMLQKALGLYNSPNPAAGAILNPASLMKGLAGSETNPNAAAANAAAAFNPQIAQLIANEGTTKSQNAQDLADIQNWFGSAANAAQQGAASDQADLTAAQGSNTNAAAGLLAAIGGDASGSAAQALAKTAMNNNQALAGQGDATTSFDHELQSIMGLSAADAGRQQMTQGNNALQTIMDSLSTAKQQQGTAAATARQSAISDLFGQKSSIATLGSNLEGNKFNELNSLRSEKLSELGGLSNAILASAMGPSQIQGAQLGNALTAGNVVARTISNQGLLKQVDGLGAAGSRDISAANAGTRDSIATQLGNKGGEFINANGDLKMPPQQVMNSVKSYMINTLGLTPNAALMNYMKGVLSNSILTPIRMQNYNKAHGTSFTRAALGIG